MNQSTQDELQKIKSTMRKKPRDGSAPVKSFTDRLAEVKVRLKVNKVKVTDLLFQNNKKLLEASIFNSYI